MTIKTKFNIGDKVYVQVANGGNTILDNMAELKIVGVRIVKRSDPEYYSVAYYVKDKRGNERREEVGESILSSSKSEVIKKIITQKESEINALKNDLKKAKGELRNEK